MEDEILRERNASAMLPQKKVSKSPPLKEVQQEPTKTYHLDRNCKHVIVRHKHQLRSTSYTRLTPISKADSLGSQQQEASVTQKADGLGSQQQEASATQQQARDTVLPCQHTNIPSCPSEGYKSVPPELDLTQPCQQHIHKSVQQRRMERIDLIGQPQNRLDQIESTFPYHQQLFYQNFRANDGLRFGHLGERNGLCSMCVCRWVNKRLY